MLKRTLIGAAAVLAMAAPALAQPECMTENDLYNWTSPNAKTVILESNRGRKVVLRLVGACPELAFHENLAFGTPGSTRLSCISAGDTLTTLTVGGGRHTCAVASVEPFTPGHDYKHEGREGD